MVEHVISKMSETNKQVCLYFNTIDCRPKLEQSVIQPSQVISFVDYCRAVVTGIHSYNTVCKRSNQDNAVPDEEDPKYVDQC